VPDVSYPQPFRNQAFRIRRSQTWLGLGGLPRVRLGLVLLGLGASVIRVSGF